MTRKEEWTGHSRNITQDDKKEVVKVCGTQEKSRYIKNTICREWIYSFPFSCTVGDSITTSPFCPILIYGTFHRRKVAEKSPRGAVPLLKTPQSVAQGGNFAEAKSSSFARLFLSEFTYLLVHFLPTAVRSMVFRPFSLMFLPQTMACTALALQTFFCSLSF